MTGALPAETRLPAIVTLPYPETAFLNTIARIDGSDGQLKDDIFSNPAPGELTFITPDLRFRYEYYFPYAVNNNQRNFNFTWTADLSVNNFQIKIQQPLSASSLATKPAATDVSKGKDGLTYYALPVQIVSAGQTLSVQVDYTMTKAQLSIEYLVPPSASVQNPGFPVTSTKSTHRHCPIAAIIVFGIIIVIVIAWLIATGRVGSKGP